MNKKEIIGICEFLKVHHFENSYKLLDYITNLQEENEQLKELCDKYEEEHNTTFIEWQKDIKANKKVIEYINEMCLCSDGYANYGDDLRPEHIVNILQGKEQE